MLPRKSSGVIPPDGPPADPASSYHLRSPEEIARFFDGLTLVPPGVVTASRWRPDLADASAERREVDAICGVARKD